MKRIVYDQEKLQHWADNEQDAFISAGTLTLPETAEIVGASRLQDEGSASKKAVSRKSASKTASVAK